jgi:beta-1,4-N-acetylglucosaminyltransferase
MKTMSSPPIREGEVSSQPVPRRLGTLGRPEQKAELLLVCSTGGHLWQMLALKGAWEPFSRVWVTFDKSDARSLLQDEDVVFAHGPTNRSVKNLLRNLGLAWRVIRRVRPTVVLTTGAGVAVPFAWIARLRGARVVYVESFTRIDRPSLSCRLIAPAANRIYAQWPELVGAVPRARFIGNVFFDR